MTPPKITRPPEKPVEHTFPAYYVHKFSDTIWYMHSKTKGRCCHNAIIDDNEPVDCTDATRWERLPSGTEITFTQP